MFVLPPGPSSSMAAMMRSASATFVGASTGVASSP